MGQNPRMSARPEAARIMLGFVVRQCAVALGHAPTPEELASWANEQRDARGRYRIFGREISTDEARVILRHLGAWAPCGRARAGPSAWSWTRRGHGRAERGPASGLQPPFLGLPPRPCRRPPSARP